jgi:hypothetical protein
MFERLGDECPAKLETKAEYGVQIVVPIVSPIESEMWESPTIPRPSRIGGYPEVIWARRGKVLS